MHDLLMEAMKQRPDKHVRALRGLQSLIGRRDAGYEGS